MKKTVSKIMMVIAAVCMVAIPSVANASEQFSTVKYDTTFTYLGDNQWQVSPNGEQFALHNIGSKQSWLCNTNNVGPGISKCIPGNKYVTNGETESIPNGTKSCIYIQGDSPAWDTVPNDPTKSVCAIDDPEPTPTPAPTPVKPDVITRTKQTVDCKGGEKNLVITDYYTTDWTWNGTEWVKQKEVWSHKTKAPATAEQCPTPTPEPTPTPTPEPTPADDNDHTVKEVVTKLKDVTTPDTDWGDLWPMTKVDEVPSCVADGVQQWYQVDYYRYGDETERNGVDKVYEDGILNWDDYDSKWLAWGVINNDAYTKEQYPDGFDLTGHMTKWATNWAAENGEKLGLATQSDKATTDNPKGYVPWKFVQVPVCQPEPEPTPEPTPKPEPVNPVKPTPIPSADTSTATTTKIVTAKKLTSKPTTTEQKTTAKAQQKELAKTGANTSEIVAFTIALLVFGAGLSYAVRNKKHNK
jgi:hypothetical protein